MNPLTKKKKCRPIGKILNFCPHYQQQIPVKVTINSPIHFPSNRNPSRICEKNYNSPKILSSSIAHFNNGQENKNQNSNDNQNESKTYNNIKESDLIEFTLTSLGVDSCYLETFYNNRINFEDLLLLTREDLKEMNLPIGPRNRILNFISKFSGFSSSCGKNVNIDVLKSFFYKLKTNSDIEQNNYNNTIGCEQEMVLSQRNSRNNFSLNEDESLKKDCIFSSKSRSLIMNQMNSKQTYSEISKKGSFNLKEIEELIKIKEKLKQQLNLCNLSIQEKKEVRIYYININLIYI